MSDSLPTYRTRTLTTQHLGRRLLVFPQLDSTNTAALSLADDPANHGVVLLAEEQSAGRGQHGRTWQAPPRSSVLMSLLLFPPAALRRPALLVAWAAVSVCEVIARETGLDATIKWPNDVLVAGKKVCGILIEQRTGAQHDWPLATVAGIGLNVTQTADDFAKADLPDAGSLLSIAGVHRDTETVAVRLIAELDEQYGRMLAGDCRGLETLWQRRLGLLGRQVRVETPDRPWCGRLIEMTLAELCLASTDGERVRLAPELVRHIRVLE